MEYGGNDYGSNVYLYHAAPTIQASTIQHSSGVGIYVYGSGSGGALTDNVITENASHGIHVNESAHPTLSGNSITLNGGNGIYSASANCYATVEDNQMQSNGEYALSVHPNSVHTIGDNWGSGNGTNHPGEAARYDMLNIRGGEIHRSVTWSVQDVAALPRVSKFPSWEGLGVGKNIRILL